MSWQIGGMDDLSSCAVPWSELAASQASHPFLELELVRCAARHFGEDARLARYELGGTVRAIAVVRSSGRWAWETFAPAQLPFAQLLVAPDVDAADCIAQLFRALGPTALLLSAMHVDGRYASAGVGSRVPGRRIPYAETISIESPDGFDAYVASRSKKLRDNMKRYQKRLAAAFGNVELKVLGAVEDMPDVVRAHGELEAKGWKGREGSAVSQQAAQIEFYTEALQLFARSGGAVAFQLRCDGAVIASRFGIVSNGIFIFLKTAYAEEHRNLAPGRILQWLAVGHVLDKVRPRTIEFYTKADADQKGWATSTRMIEHVEIARSPLVGKGLAAVRSLRGRFRRPATPAAAAPEKDPE